MSTGLKRWWSEADRFDQVSEHLRLRGVATFCRGVIATICAVLCLTVLVTVFSETGPRSTFQIVCAVAAGAGAASGAALWLSRWPSGVQARRFTVVSIGSIALAGVAQEAPIAGVVACTAFATMAGYIAMVHSARLMMLNFAVASATAGLVSIRVAQQVGVVTAICILGVIATLIVAVPLGIQVAVHVLGSDALRADRDPLTGLLNRGAFRRRLQAYLLDDPNSTTQVSVAVIDLDRFKHLNDTRGHREGDQALVAVAAAMRRGFDDSALIGRIGGEEFAVAGNWCPPELDRQTRALCTAIAALPWGVSASIGTIRARTDATRGDVDSFIDHLISAADGAMYTAKRSGGNQVHHLPLDSPPDV